MPSNFNLVFFVFPLLENRIYSQFFLSNLWINLLLTIKITYTLTDLFNYLANWSVFVLWKGYEKLIIFETLTKDFYWILVNIKIVHCVVINRSIHKRILLLNPKKFENLTELLIKESKKEIIKMKLCLLIVSNRI